MTHLPSALDRIDEIASGPPGRIAVFLDYDGTLTPIVDRPEDALLGEPTRRAVARLARSCPVAIVSGRDLADVRALVDLDGLYYAGSHGFDIAGPDGPHDPPAKAADALPALEAAEGRLRDALRGVEGALVERKRFSIAVHYRLVAGDRVTAVERAVAEAHGAQPGLRRRAGKKVFELQPDVEWDKGAAVRRLMRELGLTGADARPIYVGDDLTDEDAFRALEPPGVGIVVLDAPRETAATYRLRHPDDVRRLLEGIAAALEARA
jgi:trehalose 6-phosphate phosphatase